MKIGIFAASLGSGPSLTGVNTYSLALVESLYKYDAENEYFLILSEANREFYKHIKENDRWRKVFIKPTLVEDFSIVKKIYRILPIYSPFSEKLKFNYKKTGFVFIPDEVLNSIDLIHYTVFNSCSSIPFYINKPYIVTMHDLRLFYPQFQYRIGDKIYFTHITMKKIFNKVARKAVKIITEVQFVKEDIIRFLGINPDKIEVLISPLPDVLIERVNKIDTNLLNELKTKYNLPEKFLFYPSPFTNDKNHFNLIKAIKRLKEDGEQIHLVLTGTDGGALKEVLNLIEELKLSENIKYLGFVSIDELIALYHLSYGLVMPSFHESVSLPVWEAMICGKPCAVSNLCGMPDQLGQLGIYFNPYDVTEIAKAILNLWNLEITTDLRNALKDRVNKILNKERYAKELIKVYKEAFEDAKQ